MTSRELASTSERSHTRHAQPLDGQHHDGRGGGEHDGGGERHAVVHLARVPDQPEDHDRQGRAVVAGQEGGRAELPQRRREGEAAGGEHRLPHHRQVDGEQRPPRGGAQRGGGLPLPVVDAAQHRGEGAHDERQRDQRLRHRHEQRRVAQVERRLVEGDQEAEAERHRAHAQGQHEEAVERRAHPALGDRVRAARDDQRRPAPPTSRAIQVASTAVRRLVASASSPARAAPGRRRPWSARGSWPAPSRRRRSASRAPG